MERMLRRDLSTLLSRWHRDLAAGKLDALKRFTIRGFGEGALANWRNHAIWLAGIGRLPDNASLEKLLAEAGEYAGRVETRALAVFAKEQPLTPKTYIRLLAAVTVRHGWTKGGEAAAEAGDARFKQWIRAYPTKQRRDWHDRLNGTSLPLDVKFVLPGGPNVGRLVDGPHDWDSLPDAREHINCGHGLIYTREASIGGLRAGARNRRRV